jgi:phosphatidylglycerophosphatase A
LLQLIGPSPLGQNAVALVGLILFCGLNLWLGRWSIVHFGDKDPSRFVLDEAAGICLTMLFLPASAGRMLAIKLLAVFLTFRVFDITKPPPARQLESLPSAWGILMDDLAAAVYANLACQIILRWLVR